jgi:hypothetical protein
MKTAPASLLAAFLLLASCSPEAPMSASPTGESPEPSEDGPFIRSCSSAVLGDLGPDWRQAAAVSGPIALLGVAAHRKARPQSFAPRAGRYPSWKVLVVVERGRSVTLMVSAFDNQPVRLLYDESVWRNDNRYPLSDGDSAVTFEPCDDRRVSQFNGSFLMSRPGCARLEVWLEGERQARALQVPFGRNASC